MLDFDQDSSDNDTENKLAHTSSPAMADSDDEEETSKKKSTITADDKVEPMDVDEEENEAAANNKHKKKSNESEGKSKSRQSQEPKESGGSSLADIGKENTMDMDEKKVDGGEVKQKPSSKSKGAAATAETKNNSNGASNGGTNNNSNGKATDSKANTAAAPAAPPPPVLKGTLSYNLDLRRHLIRGMWNYENSNAFPPQRFELLRNLPAGEDPTELPKDGEFHGSFSLAYFHTTSKGKQKERSKVIPESGVKIIFTQVPDADGEYKVDGTGTNQFGVFHINGTATASTHEDDPTYNIVLRKRYEPSGPPPASGNEEATTTNKSKKRKKDATTPVDDVNDGSDGHGPLPPPSKSFSSGVVCLRGKLYKEEADDLGLGATDVVHRIHGMWSSGLDFILADPQNVRGLCNRFEYEHKSSQPSSTFPVSGRYSGWFDLSTDDGKKTRIMERDVVLRFIKNNAGYRNVEGRGSNAFGKYSITGTLTMDNVITIFRQFQARKASKSKTLPVTSAPPPINDASRKQAISQPAPEPQIKYEDVKIPDDGEEEDPDNPLEAIKPPAHTSYSAVSRGVLRLNDDGSHSCQGKWAVTREHFTNGQTSNFNFRLEVHHAQDATKKTAADKNCDPADVRQFPLDAAMYKGSFHLKKQGSRNQTVVDQQIVMKFRKNTQGAYNVYGRGINAIGVFNLIGTLIMSGKTGGQVELYRMYPPELLASTKTPGATPGTTVPPANKATTLPKPVKPEEPIAASTDVSKTVQVSAAVVPPRPGLQRRESTRLVKLPSRLEDDDPEAQLQRIMEKCAIILRFIREKDIERGAFFSEPVDPVALGIPTYHQVIPEPMDLRTVHKNLESGDIESPEEFSRMVRLTFENAMTFNVDPGHSVHQVARNLLILFNQKFRDVERMIETYRRNVDVDDKGKKKKKDDKKRKRGAEEETKSLKRRRLEEAQAMATSNANAINAIVAVAPASPNASVTRTEFSMLINVIQQLQQQIVQTHRVMAELFPGDETDNGVAGPVVGSLEASLPASEPAPAPAPAPERKKPNKRKSAAAPPPEPKVEDKPAVNFDESKPLTLQEQELLTDTINRLPPEQLPGVIQIIRESAPLSGDEDEIDLEIDQLETSTQRKLLRYVSKYIKPPKRSKGKASKKSKAAAPAPAPSTAPATEPSKKAEKPAAVKKESSPKPKTSATDSFFAFGSKEDSETESDDDEPPKKEQPKSASTKSSGGKQTSSSKSDGFELGDSFASLQDDNDEDIGNGGLTANWNISKSSVDKKKDKDGDEDDAWGAAREEAAAAKAREADRKAREEKMKEEAEKAKNQRLADAVSRGEEIRQQHKEKEENERKLKEQQEKEAEEARRAARDAARAQVQSVEQTVDLDAQRDIMKQYEQNFLDKELGSASPSSDFGF